MDTASPRHSRRRKVIIALISLISVVLVGIAAVFVWYAVTRKPLTQIPILAQTSQPSYAFTMYDISQPIGVAVDDVNDRVYVTQTAGTRDVVVRDTTGKPIGALKAPDPKALHTPVYVAVNPTNAEVLVSDRATATIYVYDAAGKYLREMRPKGVRSWQPMGLAFDRDGNLYATNVQENKQTVLKIAPDGRVLTVYGEKDGLTFPNGVAVAEDGTLFVADSNNSRVLQYSSDGRLVGALARGASGTPLGLPRGLSIDDQGRLYVVDTTNHDFQVFTPSDLPSSPPQWSFTLGDAGSVEGTFQYPNGIATDTRGRIYITDRENNRLQVWSY